jgi:hypothetical protein
MPEWPVFKNGDQWYPLSFPPRIKCGMNSSGNPDNFHKMLDIWMPAPRLRGDKLRGHDGLLKRLSINECSLSK